MIIGPEPIMRTDLMDVSLGTAVLYVSFEIIRKIKVFSTDFQQFAIEKSIIH